jgi:SAM-dependent methyltransferase
MRRLPESIYSLLTPGFAYSGYQAIIGAGSFRRRFLDRPDVFTSGSLVLDIGCGPGESSKEIQQTRYVGYEPNPRYVERAKREYGTWGEFHCGDAMDVPADFHCDTVLLMAVLSCVPDNVLRYTLETARRVLLPGGVLLAHDGVYANGQSKGSKFMLDIERNSHIRHLDEYRTAVTEFFPESTFTLKANAYRIPYSMVLVESRA